MKNFKSVSEYGAFEDNNGKSMEDGHYYCDDFTVGQEDGYFGVYDGHGGKMAVEIVVNSLHQYFSFALKNMESNNNKSVKDAFVTAFHMVDQELKERKCLYQGSTAVVCYIHKEKTSSDSDGTGYRRVVSVGNVGDSRCVLNRRGKAFRMSYDHKASDPIEEKRIVENDGRIINNRVNGSLGVARALGDHSLKDWVLADPYFSEFTLTEHDRFLVLASDGIFDVMSDQEVVDLLEEKGKSQKLSSAQMAELLVKTAKERGTKDNLTVCVLIF